MNPETLSLPALLGGALLAGLAGSAHCLSMCGPIAALLGSQAATPARQLSYQFGRIGGYVVLGVLGAGLLQSLVAFSGVRVAGLAVRLLLIVTLILIGGYLLVGWRAIDVVTRVGARFWNRLRPLAARWLPPRHAGQAMLLGLVWGWLPCGMVYAMLSVAWSTADVTRAGLTMFAFGLGTTPMVLSAAAGSAWLQQRLGRGGLRRLAGALLLLTALLSLAQMAPGLFGGGQHEHAGHGHHGQVQPAPVK